MSTPLLTTKLYMPPLRPRLVPRLRLIQRLDLGLQLGRRLTLASAPAGFGKTTLLSSWLHNAAQPVAWLSLDKDDNDPLRFLAYVVAALQTVDPAIGQATQSMLQAPQRPTLEPLLTDLVNDIAAAPQPMILVLDDYHVIETPAIHEAVTFLLDHLPPPAQGLHLVIATRADPPLPVARLRARAQLTELHTADLRFRPDEVLAFLNEVMQLSLKHEQITALEKRTEGWIAGLQLAALALQGTLSARGPVGIPDFVEAFAGSHRYVLDYLTEEVLVRQPQQVQDFLLQTAILDRLTGPLCNALTGGSDGQQTLESLEAANLFVVPLDAERRWYRYHRLFADLLRQRLRREHRDLAPELHRRASRWYEDNGFLPEAIGHLLNAGDFQRAASLLEQSGWPLLARGEMTAFLGWLDALPDHEVRARPRLSVLHGWALALTGQGERVEVCLVGVDLQPVMGEVAALRGYVADLEGDRERARQLCQQALESLPEENLFLRSLVALILGTGAYWQGGDPAAALQVLAEATTLGQASGNVHLDVTATCTLGHVQIMQGQLHLAVDTFGRAFQIATAAGKPPTLFVGLGHLGMAEVLYEWNDLEGAMDHARKGLELGERAESVDVLQAGYSYIPLARLHQALGDGEKAAEALQKAERWAQQWNQAHVLALVSASRAQLWLAQGNLAAAVRWLERSQHSEAGGPAYQHEFERITQARVLAAQGKADQALRLLLELEGTAEAMGRMGRLIQILVLQALAHQSLNEERQALSALHRALCLAELEGYVRTFLDEGAPVDRLLSRFLISQRTSPQAEAQNVAVAHARRLRAAFGDTSMPAPVVQALVEPLTDRELEVLHLIAAGLSNQEIADELVVALSTVKSHINHIYGKLDVQSRTQALIKAQELALL